MALGANRDYKTRDRAIMNNLKKHHAKMDEIMKADANITREQASKQAYKELFTNHK